MWTKFFLVTTSVKWIKRGFGQWLGQGYCLILYLMINKTKDQWLGRMKDFNNKAIT